MEREPCFYYIWKGGKFIFCEIIIYSSFNNAFFCQRRGVKHKDFPFNAEY